MPPTAGFSIRLGVKDEATVRKALETLGADGEKALRRMEKAAKRAESQGFKAFRAGARQAELSAASLGSRLGPLGVGLGALGPAGIAAAAGLVVVTAGLSKAVAAANELEKSTFKIQQLLRVTQQASGQTLESIEELARRIGKETLASTAEVRESAAVLLTFKNVAGDAFGRTLALAQDLSAVMGTQLRSSVVQLAKALEDPERNLSQLNRSGISFTLSQIEMVKAMKAAGDEAGTLSLILGVIEGQLGGAGIAEAGGLAGAWDSVTEEMTRFFETIAERTGIMDTLTDFLRSTASGLEDVNEILSVDPLVQRRARISAIDAELALLATLPAAPGDLRASLAGVANKDAPSFESKRLELVAERLRLETEIAKILDDQVKLAAEQNAATERFQAAKKRDTDLAAVRAEIEKKAFASVKERTKELEKQLKAEARREKAVAAFLAGAEREAELAKLTSAERAIQLALIKAATTAGRELTDIEEQRLRLALERRAEAEAAQGAAEKDAAAAQAAAEEAAEAARIPFLKAAADIERGFNDAFFNVFRGTENRDLVGDFLDFVQDGFARLLADLATMALVRPIVLPIVTALVGGGAADALGGLSGGGGIGGGFNLAGLFQGNVLSDSLNAFGANLGFSGFTGGVTTGFDAAGFISAGGQFGPSGANLFGATTLSGLLGAAGIGALAGSILGPLFGLNPTGSTIGGGLGAGLGFAVGGPIGGVIGGLIGLFGGGLFGGGESPRGATLVGNLQPGAEGLLEVFRVGADNDATESAARAFANQITQALNVLVTAAGGEFNRGFILQQTERQGLILGEGGGSRIFGQDEAGLLRTLLGEFTTGIDPRIASVISGSTRTDINELVADIQLASAVFNEELFETAETMTQAERAIEAINEQFEELSARASEIDLPLERIIELRDNALLAFTTGFDDAIRQQILGMTDPLALAMDNLVAAQENRLSEAIALGADLAAVERLTALELQRFAEQTAQQATSGLQAFLDSITFGALSGASPANNLSGTEAAFRAAAAQALAGDASAASRIPQLGAAFLDSSRNFFASGAGFQEDLSFVRSVTNSLIEQNTAQSNELVAVVEAGNTETISLLSRINDNTKDQDESLDELVLEIGKLVTRIDRLVSAA